MKRFASIDRTLEELFHRDASIPAVESLLAAETDEWTISGPLGRYLASLVIDIKPRSLLEFGAGRSSLILATALDHVGGGRLTSVEHQPSYCRDPWMAIRQLPSVDAELCESELRLRVTRHGLMYGYTNLATRLAARAPYDFVLIDAPPGNYGRDSPMYDVYGFLAEDALIVMDDASRQSEQTAIRRWLATFPGLRIAASNMTYGRGTVVLVHSGDKRRRFSGRSVLGTAHDGLHRLLYGLRTK